MYNWECKQSKKAQRVVWHKRRRVEDLDNSQSAALAPSRVFNLFETLMVDELYFILFFSIFMKVLSVSVKTWSTGQRRPDGRQLASAVAHKMYIAYLSLTNQM